MKNIWGNKHTLIFSQQEGATLEEAKNAYERSQERRENGEIPIGTGFHSISHAMIFLRYRCVNKRIATEMFQREKFSNLNDYVDELKWWIYENYDYHGDGTYIVFGFDSYNGHKFVVICKMNVTRVSDDGEELELEFDLVRKKRSDEIDGCLNEVFDSY